MSIMNYSTTAGSAVDGFFRKLKKDIMRQVLTLRAATFVSEIKQQAIMMIPLFMKMIFTIRKSKIITKDCTNFTFFY
ncbi:hypothetical protein EG343_07430 [Chryseobacterium nakagawai]|uniref:Uncharacterized protein n=1 Tax=Chryseobacterium nakagawai TaxID=1241982 RepID=A0AAD0YJZ9_CHRNA|nr:hypothetical protein EG343_07430 [Chryseobacterium nakagawai]